MMELNGIVIPNGNSKEDIKAREKIIKDFYASWIAGHPDKKIWNESLRDFIYVKFLSINETYNKAARRKESTAAVFFLTEILQNATLVAKKPTKKNDKNQKSFDKLFIMKYGDIKLVVGNQQSMGHKVQYTLSVPTGSDNQDKKKSH